MQVFHQILQEVDQLLLTISEPKEIQIPLIRYQEFVAACNAGCGCNRKRIEWYKGVKVSCNLDLNQIQVI